MKIGNSLSISLSNRLLETSKAINKSLTRLSTGSRLTRPGDDIASFSQAVQLDAKARGMRQASLNLNAGLGFFQTADAALANQLELVQSIRDLAVDALNSELTSSQREGLQLSLNSLMESFNQIVQSTSFDGKKLLDGSLKSLDFTLDHKGNLGELQLQKSRAQDNFVLEVGTGKLEQIATSSSTLVDGAPNELLLDVTGDGNLDLITISQNEVRISKGNGIGGFAAPESINLGGGADGYHVEAADLTGNGALDLVVYSQTAGTDYFAILENDGTGSFTLTSSFAGPSGLESDSFVLVDVNGNGQKDLVSLASGGDLQLRLGNGDGTFQAATTISTGMGGGLTKIKAADLNGNGLVDLAILQADTNVTTFSGDGSGGFTSTATLTNGDASDFLLADIKGNGHLDIVILGGDSFEIFQNDGTGGFGSTQEVVGAADFESVNFIDFNRNGMNDLIFRMSDGSLALYENKSGSFSLKSSLEGDFLHGLLVGDLKGDGFSEIVAFNDMGEFVSFRLETETIAALDRLQLSSVEAAQRVVEIADNAIANLTEKITKNSFQVGRLERWSNHADGVASVVEEARQSLLEADIAFETAELVRLQILQEAQVATLSQINLNAQLVLELFKLS